MKKIREYLKNNSDGGFYLDYMTDDQVETMLVDHFKQVGLKITQKGVSFEEVAAEAKKEGFPLERVMSLVDDLLAPKKTDDSAIPNGVTQGPAYDLMVENLVIDAERKHYSAVVKMDLKGVNKAGMKVSGYYKSFERVGNGVILKNGRNIFSEKYELVGQPSNYKVIGDKVATNNLIRQVDTTEFVGVEDHLTLFFDVQTYNSIKFDMFPRGVMEALKDRGIAIHESVDGNYVRVIVEDVRNKSISLPRARLYAKQVFDFDGSRLK